MIKWIFAITFAASMAMAETNYLEGSTSVKFVDTGAVRSANLAVKPNLVHVTSNDFPQLVEFSLGDARFDAKSKPLFASWIASSQEVSGLSLTLDDSVRMPGTYQAILAPFPDSRPSERLSLQITIPPAKLDVTQKLVVARTVGFPGYATSVAPPLEVRESGRWTTVKYLKVSRIASFAGLSPISAGIDALQSSNRVAAGQSTDIGYSLKGDFPLGVVSGKLQLSAIELAEPVTLDYEVRSRLSSLYIPITIGVGFLLGFFVRVYLANVIAVGAATKQAGDLLKQVNDSIKTHPGPIFIGKFQKAQQDLEGELAKRRPDAKEILRLVPLLETAWRDALTDFAKRQAEAMVAHGELSDIIASHLMLPTVVESVLEAVRIALSDARQQLDDKNIDDAQTTIENARKTFGGDIRQVGIEWQEGIRSLCDSLADAKTGLPAVVVSQFQEKVKGTGSINQIGPSAGTATMEDLRKLLVTFQTEYLEIHALLGELCRRLDNEWVQIQTEIQGVRKQFNDNFQQLQESYAKFRQSVKDAANNPMPLSNSLAEQLAKLEVLWRTGLLEQAPPAKQSQLEELFKAHDFLGLARAVKLSQADVVRADVLLSANVVKDLQRQTWMTEQRASPTTVPQLNGTVVVSVPLPPLRPAITVQDAKVWQGFIVGGLFICVYWMLHAESFGESWSEPAGLLVLSFMTDLTTDGLLSALQKLKG
jgi:hypothetical protein